MKVVDGRKNVGEEGRCQSRVWFNGCISWCSLIVYNKTSNILRGDQMKHTVTLIPGDGIGPEVTKPTLEIIKAAGVDIEWEQHLAGAGALKKHKTTIPKELIDSFTENKIALKGPVTTPVDEGFPSVN